MYCEECLVHHDKLKVNITHSITDVKDIASNVYSMKQEVIMNCTDHNKPLEIFCDTCRTLVCRDCVLLDHRSHNNDIITSVFYRHEQEIKEHLKLVKKKIAATNHVLTALSKREKEIVKQGEDTSKEIHLYAQQIIESVQQCEGLLVKQVDASVQHKLKLLGEQVKEAETALKQLKSCEEYIEQSLEVGSPQQILLEKQRMIEGMGAVSEQINPEVFQPVEEADITFTRNKTVIDNCRNIGKVNCLFSYPPSKPRKIVPGLEKPRCIAVNKEGVMVVGGEGYNCITVVDKDGRMVRSFGLESKIFRKNGNCWGIAFTIDGHIVMSSADDKLYKLTLKGNAIASVGGKGSGPLEFKYPRGVAIHPRTGKIYVADRNNHRIQVINDDFTYSHSIGSKGTALGQLYLPRGVALDSAGNIYICNRGNTSIDVFTSDGAFIRRFGSRGSGDGELGYIVSIAVENLVYVTDNGNHCISIFTNDGQFIQTIGSEGSGEGHLDNPWGIAVDGAGTLYVVDNGNERLIVF